MVGVALAGAAAVPLTSAALGALGFGAAGVVAGSLAAGWQSAIGNVEVIVIDYISVTNKWTR